jgi:hypothetical protein
MLNKTTLVITNRTVEIEREGANVFLTVLTCGCWYYCFQSATIEIYDLQQIQTLYLKDGIITGEVGPGRTGREQCCGRSKFIIDMPKHSDKPTKDIFFELKEAWHIVRHSVLQEQDDVYDSSMDDSDGLLIMQ